MPHSTHSQLRQDLEAGFSAMSTAAIMLHETVARELGLNATDHKCMGLLCQHGRLSAGALAEMTGLTTGAVTGIITRLEQAGYVRRAPNPADARSVIVEPINAASFLQVIGKLLEPLRTRMNQLVGRYTKKDLNLILRFMTEAVQISREETFRLTQASTLARRFGTGLRGADEGSSGPEFRDRKM